MDYHSNKYNLEINMYKIQWVAGISQGKAAGTWC
jgi:hypothetical protein